MLSRDVVLWGMGMLGEGEVLSSALSPDPGMSGHISLVLLWESYMWAGLPESAGCDETLLLGVWP